VILLDADMNKEGTACLALIEKTTAAINNDALKLLFMSIQQNNLDLCAKNAVVR
jgi:hypothetical protein